MDRIADRRWNRRHRAHDVTAGGEGRQQCRVDLGDRGFEPGFDDAVELDALAGGDPQRPVRLPIRQRIEGEILAQR